MAKKRASLKVLNKNSTRLIRQEYMDYDYINKLSDKEKQYLADFTDEYYNASVGKQKDNGKNNRFHKSKELVKERQTANNKVNNDVQGKARASKSIVFMDYYHIGEFSDRNRNSSSNTMEDLMIAVLDEKKKLRDSSDDSDDDS